jgi:hypothetical protein
MGGDRVGVGVLGVGCKNIDFGWVIFFAFVYYTWVPRWYHFSSFLFVLFFGFGVGVWIWVLGPGLDWRFGRW